MALEAEFEPETNSLYLRAMSTPVSRMVKLANGMQVDLDAQGCLVGLRIVDPTADQLLLGQEWVDEIPDQKLL